MHQFARKDPFSSSDQVFCLISTQTLASLSPEPITAPSPKERNGGGEPGNFPPYRNTPERKGDFSQSCAKLPAEAKPNIFILLP